MLIDLDNRKTAMLLMIRAQATVMGATCVNACLELVWAIAGFYPVEASTVVARVSRNQGLAYAVGSAPLLIIYVFALDNDLGRHRCKTLVAK